MNILIFFSKDRRTICQDFYHIGGEAAIGKKLFPAGVSMHEDITKKIHSQGKDLVKIREQNIEQGHNKKINKFRPYG